MADDTFTAADFAPAPSGDTSTASPATETAAPVDTAASEGAATTEPVADTTGSPSTEQPKAGPIPFDAHKTALENARTKAVEEWKAKYGWAEQVDAAEFQQLQQIARHFAGGDVINGLQHLIAEIRKDPQYDAALRSLAAKQLAAARSQSAEPQEPQADLPIQLEDGRVVHLYSAEQQAKREAFLQQKWLSQVKQEFSPLVKTHEDLQTERAAYAKQVEVGRYVESTFKDVTTWPGMDDPANQKAVANALATMRVNDDDPREVSLALNAAYRQVVLPTLHSASRRAVLTTLNEQANASTVNPAATSTRAPKSMDEMSIAEALAYEAAQQA
jgi:hypothetical protein